MGASWSCWLPAPACWPASGSLNRLTARRLLHLALESSLLTSLAFALSSNSTQPSVKFLPLLPPCCLRFLRSAGSAEAAGGACRRSLMLLAGKGNSGLRQLAGCALQGIRLYICV